MDNNQPTKDIFDATIQQVVPHTLEVSPANGDIIATSTTSGHFIKFPGTSSAEEVNSLIAEHQAANEGQQSLAEANAVVQEVLNTPATPAPDATPAPAPAPDPAPVDPNQPAPTA